MCGKPMAFRKTVLRLSEAMPQSLMRGVASKNRDGLSVPERLSLPHIRRQSRNNCCANLASNHALRFQQTLLRAARRRLRPAFAFVGPADTALGGSHL